MVTSGRREEREQDVDERERRGDRMLMRGRGEERRQDDNEKERRT